MPATIGVKEAESISPYCGVECNFTLWRMQCIPLDRVSTKLLRAAGRPLLILPLLNKVGEGRVHGLVTRVNNEGVSGA
jgi:hypothetical protein